MDLHQASVPLSSIMRKHVDRCGWLTFLSSNGILKAWKRRYFVLRSNRLFYFKSDKLDEPVAGMVNLDCYATISTDTSFKKTHVFRLEPRGSDASKHAFFKLSSNPGKPFIAFCDDEHDIYLWMESIRINLVRMSNTSVLDDALAKLDFDKYRKIPKPKSTMSIKIRNSEESLDSIAASTMESASSSIRSKSPDHEDRDLLYPIPPKHRLGYRGLRRPVSGWAHELNRRKSSPFLSHSTTSPLAQASQLMVDWEDDSRPRALTLQPPAYDKPQLFPELHDFRVICPDDDKHGGYLKLIHHELEQP